MATRTESIKMLKQAMTEIDQRGYVYQFPKGHWSWASFASPIGQSLRESGMIYPAIDCKAQRFEMIAW